MKLRHLPVVLRHYPGFVLRHGPQMLAHTFRGSSWRSVLGLESSRDVFKRYKEIRRRERQYLPEDLSLGGRTLTSPGDAGSKDPAYV